jgi:hexosaminidase
MSESLALMPWPRRVTRTDATLALTEPTWSIEWAGVRTLRLERTIERFTERMARASGGGARLTIDCAAASAPYPDLDDDESYSLAIDSDDARVTAATEWGVLRGIATLVQINAVGRVLPGVLIADAPRFTWRGLMVDGARHFISVGTLLRTLDAMALVKLNVLHLHLTDDQAFRFGSRAFPELAELGSDGNFYSEDDLGEIVTRAAELGIRVVPEIDMPGHTTSWLAAHPEWGTVPETRQPSDRFGVHSACLDPTREDVYDALGRLFDDVARVFPDRFVHIGGDEVNPKWWQESSAVQRFMRERGFADVDALQNHFNARLADMLIERGRMLIGWDEIAHGDLPRTSVVQSWRGGASRDRAIAQGFDCVFSAGYYLDFFYPADLHYAYDPESPADELIRLDERVRADPRVAHVRDGLGWAAEFAGRAISGVKAGATPPGRVLGGEACMWAEIVTNDLFEVRVWGRLPAIAERLWSPRALRDEDDMYLRLARLRPLLHAGAEIDLETRKLMLFASIGVDSAEFDALRPLLDAIEPTKWYSRLLGAAALQARVAGSTAPVERPYTVATPLNRVVDFIDPASPWVVQFNAAVRAAADEAADDEDRKLLIEAAAGWRRQRDAVRTIGARVPAIAELETISQRLASLAEVIEAALTERVGASHRATLNAAKEQVGELLIAAVPALDDWVHSS